MRKVFKIGKRDKTRPLYITNVHMWGEIVLYIAFKAGLFFVTTELSETKWMSLVMTSFFFSIGLFCALMEWIYQKEQREYIIHLLTALVLLLFVVSGLYKLDGSMAKVLMNNNFVPCLLITADSANSGTLRVHIIDVRM